MESSANRAIAIVGSGAILPDAPSVAAFWENIQNARYSITEVTPDRWDPALYYDPDPKAPDKTYTRIGGWVRQYAWEPTKWHLPLPPRVTAAMDEAQQWGIACTREALDDYGYPKRALDLERTAVILGNAMAGEKHYLTALRVSFPEYARELAEASSFAALPEALRRDITRELHDRIARRLPEVTEDSMPGELANCLAGRIANLFNFRGPNFIVDAACASAIAAVTAAFEGLAENQFDAAIAGGIDRNMGAPMFVKFCKIGALSATGSRPYAEGADGFVMGEGAAVLLLKRLADAERDGDNIYAVIRGIAGSSDGKGKGITAPNPVGQKLCIQRAWQNAGIVPAAGTLIEGHGTSTRVGDVVEVQSMVEAMSGFHLPTGSIALGSVKSNIGHLKGAAGAAGLLKTALALRDKVLPPSVQCARTNPDIDFAHSPIYVSKELRPWTVPAGGTRRAGVSAFGFGGTNFHAVLEEYIPGRLNGGNGKRSVVVAGVSVESTGTVTMHAQDAARASSAQASGKVPMRGALVIGAESLSGLTECLREVKKAADAGQVPSPAPPAESDLLAPERVAIDYGDAVELADKSNKAIKALAANQPAVWKAIAAQGIFRGQGPAAKVAFLYTGQGSQYVNMLKPLRATESIVAETFAEADRALAKLLEKPLSEYIFVNNGDAKALAKAEEDLRQTAITQPAVLATDISLTRLLVAYNIHPDFTMGHSLGEYGALVAAGALPFADALEAVTGRGREMTRVSVAENGRMAAVFAPLAEIERILRSVQGNVVIANINSNRQAVIGGASKAVDQAMELLIKAGFEVSPLSVSHAFHTTIVASASQPLRKLLERLRLQSPRLPIVANVTGDFYPMGPNVMPQMLDMLAQQVAAPVQFVKGLNTLYSAGARVFVETGPKKALQGFAEDVLGERGVVSLFTNHPKLSDIVAFNQALCGLYAAGLGAKRAPREEVVSMESRTGLVPASAEAIRVAVAAAEPKPAQPAASTTTAEPADGDRYHELGHLFADVLERGWKIYHGDGTAASGSPAVVTGAALGLPGRERIFDDANLACILGGQQFIGAIPASFREAILGKHITRLVKSENGGPSFEAITNVADVIKLAGRGGAFDLEKEFGISAERLAALDRTTCLAMAAGIDAMRDAGIPLVLRYKTTSKGTRLPDRWALPVAMRDDTGVIFASAFPGLDSFADDLSRYFRDQGRHQQMEVLENLRAHANGDPELAQEIDERIGKLRAAMEKEPYVFDRRFVFRVLPMGHSQFAEFIGARGPNTCVNAACASTTHAVSVAEDWIRTGRCRRVIIVSADDVTSDRLMEWMGAGFLATGAAATGEAVEEVAVPFDRRRNGMLLGMGGAALVMESVEAARERGIRPICELLSSVTVNSAFHGTRLDVEHISSVMEKLIAQAETRSGIHRRQIAPQTVFVSHETYTPARGGSAQAEIHALRQVFGEVADRIVIANTKGFTGHAMGTGIEDVVAVKALETGVVPPVANYKEVDPELGPLNLSKGGAYPVEYALRLGAGFGSQISMTLMRWMASPKRERFSPASLSYVNRIEDEKTWKAWLSAISGDTAADVEVVNRTLRIRDHALVSAAAADSVSAAPVVKTQPAVAATRAAAASAVVATKDAAPVAVELPEPVKAQVEKPTALADQPTAEGDPVRVRVIALVAEKTGYPADMLDLDLDLEADLGVDTVKQAEVFASIREAYGIPRDDTIRLRDFPTLAHVIRFVHERMSKAAAASRPHLSVTASQPPAKAAEATAGKTTIETKAPTPVPAVAPAITVDTEAVKERVLALVTEKTGYPKDMLDLDLDLEADLGIDTVKQAELFAGLREVYGIARDESLKLRDYPTLNHVIGFILKKRPDLAGAAAPPAIATEAASRAAAALPGKVQPSAVPADAPPGEVISAPAANSAAASAGSGPVSVMAASALASDEQIQDKVLEIVAEKTGYPKDMLDLDLDLEADLGIDTVKQAEMLAAVRAAYNISRDENLKLRDFPTLAHVIRFAQQRAKLAAVPATAEAGPQLAVPFLVSRPKLASFDAANAVPRRVPALQPRPPLSMCKPTGVTLGAGSRVIIMPDKNGVAEVLTQQLRALGVEVLQLQPGLVADALATCLKGWLAAGPVQGVYWLPALDDEGNLGNMDLAAWRAALRLRVKSLYACMRVLYEQIAKPETFLVTATRLGGQHGYDPAGATAPLGGAVVGFTKTYKRERPESLVKAVDFESGCHTSQVAARLIEETLRDNGAVETGYKQEQRWTVGFEELPAADGRPGLELNKDTVFLVTGAAGSIVSAITADLAAASGGTFYLLDLVPEPAKEDPDLKRFVSDKDGLKRDLFARIQSRGQRATPALVEKELAALERAQAARTAIDAVIASGGTPYYFSVNLTDAEAVANVIQQVRERSGRIDVLLHAAGMERSHLLPDKDPREFDLVFDVKSDGWFNLLRTIGDMPLGATVAFSSVAGRFGNGGQADYGSANDLLCKIASSFRTTRPSTRGIAIDWTAWGGIGMATRGSITKMMELAGIDMLPPEAGVPTIRRELTTGGTRGEVIIGQRLGILLNEWDATAGLDTTLVAASAAQGPMLGKVAGLGLYGGLRIETTLDPKAQPFLRDHQIDGTPVLPGVMGLEAFAEAARLLLPGWHIRAIEDINFLAPFKFYRNEPRTVTVEAEIRSRDGELWADCRIIGSRTLPTQREPQFTTHFTSRVRLSQELPEAANAEAIAPPSRASIAAADIYRYYFHGPAYRVIGRAWREGERIVGELAESLPANHQPPERPLLAAPRLIELCFQTAGLWEMGVQSRLGLPYQIQQVRFWGDSKSVQGRLYAVVTPNANAGNFDAEVVDSAGKRYLRLTSYRTMALPNSVEAEPLKALRAVA